MPEQNSDTEITIAPRAIEECETPQMPQISYSKTVEHDDDQSDSHDEIEEEKDEKPRDFLTDLPPPPISDYFENGESKRSA